MRAVILIVVLLAPAIVGCTKGPEPASDNSATVAPLSAASTTAADDAASAPAATSSPGANASTVATATNNSTPVGALPDPCAISASFTDPCVKDGLRFGQAVVWDGGAVKSARETLTPETCQKQNVCHDITFKVAETGPGARLRIETQIYFQDPSYVRPLSDNLEWGYETALDASLYPPGADLTQAAPFSATTLGSFAGEILVGGNDASTRAPLDAPQVGAWTLRFSGTLPDPIAFRARVRMEAPTVPSDAPALPDLRIIPPFEVGFMVPTTTFQPGIAASTGVPVAGCMAEEYAEAQQNGLKRPTLCLRFSMGFANVGDGAFRLKMRAATDPVGIAGDQLGLNDIPVVQSVCTADGRACHDLPSVPGLVARWHATHTHYHYQNAYVFDLYRVHANATEAAPFSTSGKLGVQPTEEWLAGWNGFDQLDRSAPTGRDASGKADPADIALQAGWGDVYDWDRAGNYVDFPADATLRPVPGEYLLRGTTDPKGQIQETNESDNTSYVHFLVSGAGSVKILERGYGRDPGDPTKTVFRVAP